MLVVGHELKLDALDLSRELFFYLLSILLLFIVMRNGRISKLDASLLVSMHIVYVLTCCLWAKIRGVLKTYFHNRRDFSEEESIGSPLLNSETLSVDADVHDDGERAMDEGNLETETGECEDGRELKFGRDSDDGPGIMESRLMLQAVREAQFTVGKDWVLSGEFLGFDYGEVSCRQQHTM